MEAAQIGIHVVCRNVVEIPR